jgi:S-adenosylmethionine decarboxylase
MRSQARVTGIEWLVEATGCDADRLRDPRALESLFDEMIADLSLRPVAATQWHVFPGEGGVTGLCMLAESHLAVHTFPEHQSLCLNLFCCRERPDWDFAGRLPVLLGALHVEVRRLVRDYSDRGAPVLT